MSCQQSTPQNCPTCPPGAVSAECNCFGQYCNAIAAPEKQTICDQKTQKCVPFVPAWKCGAPKPQQDAFCASLQAGDYCLDQGYCHATQVPCCAPP